MGSISYALPHLTNYMSKFDARENFNLEKRVCTYIYMYMYNVLILLGRVDLLATRSTPSRWRI